ncbi:MAG: cupin domain-containing protein [Planctomycetota bacterium]
MNYRIVRLDTLPATPCPCGVARRAFVDEADGVASMHLVEIATPAKTHYHKQLTELYYVLEGEGHLELDGERHPVAPGSAVLIKPGCRHRAVPAGAAVLRILNVPVPAFDPDDEWFD